MRIAKLLQANEALSHLHGVSKKRLFHTLSHIIAERNPDLRADDIFEGLTRRDRLGSTGVGHGVAIPHCRLPGCPQLVAQIATLDAPIDYDAPDGRPVDIVVVLLAPEQHHQAHLDTLSQVARLLDDPAARLKLRRAQNSVDLQTRITELAEHMEGVHSPSVL